MPRQIGDNLSAEIKELREKNPKLTEAELLTLLANKLRGEMTTTSVNGIPNNKYKKDAPFSGRSEFVDDTRVVSNEIKELRKNNPNISEAEILTKYANKLRNEMINSSLRGVPNNKYRKGNEYNVNSAVFSDVLNKIPYLSDVQDISVNTTGITRRIQELYSRALDILPIGNPSPIVQIALKRLVIELGKRAANNVIDKFTIDTDLRNDVPLITKLEDKSITKSTRKKFLDVFDLENLRDIVLGTKKVDDDIPRSFILDKDYQDDRKQSYKRAEDYYNETNDYQKGYIHKFTSMNLFSKWKGDAKNNIAFDLASRDNEKTILPFVYSYTFINRLRGDDSLYMSYVKDKSGNQIFSLPLNINTIEDLIYKGESVYNTLVQEGFGKLLLGKQSTNSPNPPAYRYDNNIKDFNIERGLLYYTQQMLNSPEFREKQHPDNIVYRFKDGNEITEVFKGVSECRSFTYNKQYDRPSRLIRYKGNSNEYSTIGETVKTRINPKVLENGKYDFKQVMFSIENLAYTYSDYLQLPECEKGRNFGRIMWFPPYSLKFNETASNNVEEVKFLGRIEPIYSYNGSLREGTLSFKLIIDCPPDVKFDTSNLTPNDARLVEFFNGCKLDDITPLQDVVINPKDNTEVPEPKITPENKEELLPPPTIDISKMVVYFDDDIDELFKTRFGGNDYELYIQSVSPPLYYGLNIPFNSEFVFICKDIANVKNYNITITISAQASQLGNYQNNIALSYRRAYNLMRDMVSVLNNQNGFPKFIFSDQDGSQTIQYNRFKNEIATKAPKPLTSTWREGKIEYISVNNECPVRFIIYGFGESPSSPQGTTSQAIDLLPIKKERYAKIDKIEFKPRGSVENIQKDDTIRTPEDIKKEIDNNDINNSGNNANNNIRKTNSDPCLGIRFDVVKDRDRGKDLELPFTKGFEKIREYAEAYHSQTPNDFWKRYTFLQQLQRPGHTKGEAALIGANSLFGRMPSAIIRVGDFYHSKVIIKNISFSFDDGTYDMNPEGRGMQPMTCDVTMQITFLGGQSMKYAIDRIQTAIDINYTMNSTFHREDDNVYKQFYPKLKKAIEQEDYQERLNKERNKNKR